MNSASHTKRLVARRCDTQSHNRIKSVIAAVIIVAVCVLGFPTTAQQTGPQNKQGAISDDDFIALQQQIKELKNPTFRAFLTIQLLRMDSGEPGPMRRQAAVDAATQGAKDFCEHQDEMWTPNAAWLHEGFVKQIKRLQSSEETAPEICVLKTEAKSNSAGKEFSSAIKMLNDPETSAAGRDLAKSAILSGQISAGGLLGQLNPLNASHSPHLAELLSSLLSLEEKRPGTLPLQLLPFFTPLFREKSVPPEVLTRYLFVAVRASRVSAEELVNPVVRGPVTELLNGIAIPARQLTPALYTEIASRLSSLNSKAPNTLETRLAAEDRIQKASDQLEQLISEANSASDDQLKKQFFSRAARLAKEQGQLNKAVDLALKVVSDRERERVENKPTWLNDFLSEIVSLALKKKSPRDATYAILKMTSPLGKARAFRLLGDYYGANRDSVNSKEAFTQSAKQLTSVENSNERVRSFIALSESVLKYEPSDAYELFRESVKAINNLPSPEKDQEKMYYVQLLPIAEDLIRSFRLLAAREHQTATNLAAEIKLSELRLSALSGACSGTQL